MSAAVAVKRLYGSGEIIMRFSKQTTFSFSENTNRAVCQAFVMLELENFVVILVFSVIFFWQANIKDVLL